MPTVRYQLRNEYGLADPELHLTGHKDDPEAILEGVAMAGLVGVLRQLGDLAEFAAEIFRGLHEEVMGTASRGHGLMLRIQQLEAEFPSVEKALFSHSSHSSFAYNDGIDWNYIVQMDQNLITQRDMPRFVLDSYEKCRGPPRLFTLEKFDTAGSGACLRRYSDPSFFKMELFSSDLLETDIQREKKFCKTRKKGSRRRNSQTLESLFSPNANNSLQPTASDKVLDKSATRFVRLISRNISGSNRSEGLSLRKGLLELHSEEQKVIFDNSKTHSNRNVNSVDSSELISEMHDIVMDMSASHPLARDASPTKTPTEVVTMLTTYELDHWKKEDEELPETQHERFSELQISLRNFNFVEKKENFADSENKSEGSAYDYELSELEKTTPLLVVEHTMVGAELKLEGSTNGDRTEDVGSEHEQENFMDALNNMESKVEKDSENKGRADLGAPRKDSHDMNLQISERLEELQTKISELDSVEVSIVSVGLNETYSENKGRPDLVASSRDAHEMDHQTGQRLEELQTETAELDPSEVSTVSVGLNKTYSENKGRPDIGAPRRDAHEMDLQTGERLEELQTEISELDPTEVSTVSVGLNKTYSENKGRRDLGALRRDAHEIDLQTGQRLEELQTEISELNPAEVSTVSVGLNKTNSENKDIPDLGTLRKDAHVMDLDTIERLEELQTEISELDYSEVSIISIGLNNILESGMSSVPYSGTSRNLTEMPVTQEQIVVSNSSANSEFFLGETNDESCKEHLPLDDVINSADLISDGSRNAKTFDNLRSDVSEEYCSPCVIMSAYSLINTDPQEGFDALQSVAANQNDTSAGHKASLETDEIAKCLDGSSHSDSSFPVKPHHAEHVDKLILEDMMDIPEMPNDLSASTRSALIDGPDNEYLSIMPVPRVKDTKHSMDQDTEDFASKENTTFSPCVRSIFTSINAFVSDSCMDVVRHDGLAADINNGQHPEQLTTETSFDYVKGTDDVTQDINGLSVGTKDDGVSESLCLTSNPVELMSGEMSIKPDISNLLSDTKHESSDSSLAKDSAWYIEVSRHPSYVTLGKSPQSINQDAEENSTETVSPPDPVIATISDKDRMAEMENIITVEKSNVAMPEIVQSEFEYFSDTEQSQRSPKVISAEEYQEFPKVNSAEEVPSCSESETFSDRIMNFPMHVLDNLKLSNEFNQDNPRKNTQEVEQIIHVKNFSAENFTFEDETNSYDPSLIYTLDASGLQSQLVEDSTPSAAVSYQHQLKTHETYSPKKVEVLDWESTLDMTVSSELEQSASDPAVSCSRLPAKDSSNDARLFGDICDTMPKEHVQAYLHACVDDTYPECPVESKQDFCSKSSAQDRHESAEQDMSLSTNLFSDPASLREEASTSPTSEEVQVELEYLHQKDEFLELDIQTNYIDADDKTSDGPEPKYHGFFNNVKHNELDILSSNTDMTIKLCSETLVSPECSSGISACHMASNVSGMTFSVLSSSDVNATESASRLSYVPQSDESTSCFSSQNPEEPPPLLPLPPLEWRTRKLQLSSLLPSENSCQSLAGTNSLMAPPFGLSELPLVVHQSHQHDALSLDGNILRSSNALSSVSSSLEYEKNLYAPYQQRGLKLPLVDPFTPFLGLESQNSQHSPSQEERIQPIPDKRYQLRQPWSGLELEEKSHFSGLGHLNLEKEMVQPQNTLLHGSASKDVNHHHDCRDFRCESMHLLKSPEFSLPSGLGMAYPSHVYSLEEGQSTLFGVVPTIEDEWFSIKPRSIRNCPRNPLIKDVAAHDRSTLRKVSELARPSNETKGDNKDVLMEPTIWQLRKALEVVKLSNKPKEDERDALLEQIRNKVCLLHDIKSFSLRPVGRSKPNSKSHATNIKVAAIVEKANAIRQAIAGSDEEDGGDSWSDFYFLK